MFNLAHNEPLYGAFIGLSMYSYIIKCGPQVTRRTVCQSIVHNPNEMGIKVVSETIGELDVTFDRWGNARATGSIEANGEDVIRVEGWTGLGASSRMMWQESVEGNLGFSIRPETGY